MLLATRGVRRMLVGATIALCAGGAQAASPSPAGAQVSIVSPKDGEAVTGPVKIVFGVTGMAISPAGTAKENSGHHHLIIDADLPAADVPVAKDAQHMHFGTGQTEASVDLPKGKHTLQLLFADHAHVPHQPVVSSKKITIEVK